MAGFDLLNPVMSEILCQNFFVLTVDKPSKETQVFWTLAVLLSFELSSAYARTVQAIPLQDWAHSRIDPPWRRRVLTQWLARIYLHIGERWHVLQHHHSIFMVVIGCLSLIITIAAARAAIASFNPKTLWLRWLALLVIPMTAFPQMLNPITRVQFAYDLPSEAFFGVATYAVFTQRRLLFYSTFLLGTLNKETTLFLPPMLFLSGLDADKSLWRALRKEKPARYLELLGGLCVWEILIKLCEAITGGHGTGMEMNLRVNLRALQHVQDWPVYISAFAYLWIPCLVFRKDIRPTPVRRIALLLPIWAAVMLFVGFLPEARIHDEWIVYVAVCIACVVGCHHASLFRETLSSTHPQIT